METAIRWSPSSTATDPRFLLVDVAGKSFKLCKITSFSGRSVEYEVISTHLKVPPFRAFDWSTSDESLIAVGQSSGEAAILRMGGDSNELWSFPIRNQRHCNAVAFSTHGLLAVGLDKVRNDVCLNIWDVNQRLAARNLKGLSADRHALEPLRKLASSEHITSIKFFKDQPDTLVAGVKGQFVRLYDLREGPGNPSLQFSTRCVHHLAINWLDENYIASCSTSSEAIVCIWDRRVGSRFISASLSNTEAPEAGQQGPALEFKNVINQRELIWSLRFSKTKRGCLGVLSNTGHFKAYDIAKEYISEEYRNSLDETLGQGSSKFYPEQIYTKYVRDIRTPFNHHTRACPESERIVSFDFLNISGPNEASAISLLGNGKVEITTLQPPCPPVRISSQSVLAYGRTCGDTDFGIKSPLHSGHGKISDVVKGIRRRIFPSSSGQTERNVQGNATLQEDNPSYLSSRENHEHFLSLETVGGTVKAEDALALLTVNRHRCKAGYLFDSARNRQILDDNPFLQDLWDWIGRAQRHSSDDSMVMNGLDMNYLGVYSIWINDLGLSLKNRIISPIGNDRPNISDAIRDLARELDLPAGKGCETRSPEHRQLCLHICGAAESYQDLEKLVEKLVSQRQHTKAAALAVFQNEPRLAFLALRNNEPTQAHKLLAMAIAGAAKGHTDLDWEQTCGEIAKELTDPYARAILALVSKGDWSSVLEETTLPLRYRVEVALRWLPDDALASYLQETTVETIQQGDIEGVVLTGLGHSAMDLFQSYIKKFNDIQTAVLAMSHAIPRFIDDETNQARFRAWRETYRWRMNSWKLQLERAKFDVGCRRLAVTLDGHQLIPPPLQHISLICSYCTRPLTQPDASAASAATSGGEVIHPTVGHPLSLGVVSGTVCPKCERHMPRCGVCSLWLGSPHPTLSVSIAADPELGDQKRSEDDVMRRFIVFCIYCNHGFHSNHARDWFARHRACPVAECGCICNR